MQSTSDRLELALSRMPSPLVSERARRELLHFSRLACPNVDLVYVECRVSSDTADRVDVSVSAATYAARAALTREVDRLVPENALLWAPIRSTFERWCQRGTAEARALESACLEYDLDPEHPGLARPSLFFRAAGLSHSWDLARTRFGLAQVIGWVAGDRACALIDQLDAVLQALPANFHIAHLGFMFSRADETLRFDVAIPGTDVDAFLRRLGWSGVLTDCREALAGAERSGWVTLGFGFGSAGVTERLGIEVFPRGRAGAAALLAGLVRDGWCTKVKGEALAAFVGDAALELPGDESRAELSHAKFVVTRAGVEVKAYIVLAPSGVRPGQLAPVGQIRARATPARLAAVRCRAGAS